MGRHSQEGKSNHEPFRQVLNNHRAGSCCFLHMLVSSGFLGHIPVMWEKVISTVHEPGKAGMEDCEAFCVAEASEAATHGCLRVPREGPRPSALAVPSKPTCLIHGAEVPLPVN